MANSSLFTELKNIVRSSCGALKTGVVSRFVADAMSIALYLKPSIIIDYWHVTKEQVSKTIGLLQNFFEREELRSVAINSSYAGNFSFRSFLSISLSELQIVNFNDAVLIINMKALSMWIENDEINFVDLRTYTPVICSQPVRAELINTFKCIIEMNGNGYSDLKFTLMGGPTFLGILLGYPIVYVCEENSDLVKESSAISNVDLCIYKCFIRLTNYTQFQCKENPSFLNNHELYSFSIPQFLYEEVRVAVENWKSTIFTNIDAFGLHASLDIIENIINLPSVSL